MVAMEYSREDIAHILRRTGFPEAADHALRDLPDPVSLEEVAAYVAQYGITRDELFSRLGASP